MAKSVSQTIWSRSVPSQEVRRLTLSKAKQEKLDNNLGLTGGRTFIAAMDRVRQSGAAGLDAVQDVAGGLVYHASIRQNLFEEGEAQVRAFLNDGSLIAFGYEKPCRPPFEPVAIPASFFRSNLAFDWDTGTLIWLGVKFTGVRFAFAEQTEEIKVAAKCSRCDVHDNVYQYPNREAATAATRS